MTTQPAAAASARASSTIRRPAENSAISIAREVEMLEVLAP